MRIFIYCRVSTDDQEDNTSLEQQEVDCREYCRINSHQIIEVFKEVYSATTWRERKVFTKMRDRYLRGEIDAVLARSYSRFTRSIPDYFILTHEMEIHNIQLLCVKEQYDGTPLGRLLQIIRMGFYEQEGEITRQRTMDGKKARAAIRGEYLAAKKPPYGYDFNDAVRKSKLIKNVKEAETVEWIFEERAKGATLRWLAITLNNRGTPSPHGKLWSRIAVRRILDNGEYLYRGIGIAFKVTGIKEYHNGKRVQIWKRNEIDKMVFLPDGTVERIISDELVQKAIEVDKINKQDYSHANTNPETTLLRGGFVRCGLCGATMCAVYCKSHKTQLYRCHTNSRTDKICPVNINIIASKLDKVVWDYTVEVVRNLTIVESVVNAALAENNFESALQSAVFCIADCDTLIDQYRQDLKRKDWKPATRTVLLEDLNTQLELKERLERELGKIRYEQVNYDSLNEELEAAISWCRKVQMGNDTELSWTEKRSHLRVLGIHVFVYPKKDEKHERYEIRIAPKGLIDVLNTKLGTYMPLYIPNFT